MRFAASVLVLVLWCAAPVRAQPSDFEDSMAQRTMACTVCHGRQGRAGPDGYYPRIAGKPAGYLYNQLLNFREGRRHYMPMTRLLDPLSEPYLLEIARHFASLNPPHEQPVASRHAPELLERGQELALKGDAPRNLPACVQCHGRALMGVQPNVPGLLGLPRDYLNAQLGAWRTGQRRAHEPDCMADIARRLSPADLSAVTAWLSTRPVPASARPAPEPRRAPAIACGSAPMPKDRAGR